MAALLVERSSTEGRGWMKTRTRKTWRKGEGKGGKEKEGGRRLSIDLPHQAQWPEMRIAGILPGTRATLVNQGCYRKRVFVLLLYFQ